jgi:hypothetical protein
MVEIIEKQSVNYRFVAYACHAPTRTYPTRQITPRRHFTNFCSLSQRDIILLLTRGRCPRAGRCVLA